MTDNNNDDSLRSPNSDLVEPLLPSQGEQATGTDGTTEANNNSGDDGSNLTASSSSFSYKTELIEMANLGIPLAISFFCRMGMASTDSSFVGHINTSETPAEVFLAAAVLSDMVVSIFTTPPLAFNQVLNALVGQAMGSGNPQMAGVWFQQSCFFLSFSMLPCLVGLWYVEPILLLLDFPSDVSALAGIYARYNAIWPIPNGLYQCMRFYFQAQGKPKPAMYNNIIFLFVNAFLNWIFVFGGPFKWNGFGFVGAAISLSISRTMQSVTYFIYMFVYKHHHKEAWPSSSCLRENHTLARTLEFMKQALPNIGTLLFSVIASQATTILVGRLGELSIAASSALSTVTIPWSGSISATCSTISGVRVGYHLGRGDGSAAQKSTRLVLIFITLATAIISILFLISPALCDRILSVATNDPNVLEMSKTLVPAMLAGTYMSLMVGNITGGVFGGMGKPLLSTILSFGLELPMSIGGVAIYILVVKGDLLGVYWFQAISGAFELVLVIAILSCSNWQQCAIDAQRRNEVRPDDDNTTAIDADVESNETEEPVLNHCCSDIDRTTQQDATARTASTLSNLSSFEDDSDMVFDDTTSNGEAMNV